MRNTLVKQDAQGCGGDRQSRAGVLRAPAINWGRFQDPPLLPTSPFTRFGVNIKVRDETKRARRIHRDEEQLAANAGGREVGVELHERSPHWGVRAHARRAGRDV
jgi:hypothetical protein